MSEDTNLEHSVIVVLAIAFKIAISTLREQNPETMAYVKKQSEDDLVMAIFSMAISKYSQYAQKDKDLIRSSIIVYDKVEPF